MTYDILQRLEKKKQFLHKAGWQNAETVALAGDASNRKYDRLHTQDKTAILMDAAPDLGEDVVPFIALTGWLRAQNLSAPQIYEIDSEQGFILLEDLGDGLFSRAILEKNVRESDAYMAAVDVLVDLEGLSCPASVTGHGMRYDITPYASDVYVREARLCLDWYVPAVCQSTPHDTHLQADFEAILRKVCAPYTSGKTLCLRDYHAENLIWLPHRHGNSRVGLLDYQDALCGVAEYDLVSLLEDARRDVSPDVQCKMMQDFAQKCQKSLADVEAACAVLSAQRNLKILGIFVRLFERDQKRSYLKYLNRVWSYLRYDLQHDALFELRRWVDETLSSPDTYVSRINASALDDA